MVGEARELAERGGAHLDDGVAVRVGQAEERDGGRPSGVC